jgi:LytR cell envelope-related transcriptional attenuator
VTGPVPPSPSEDWSGGPPGEDRISLGRALLLLVVGVVVGVLCLQVGGRPPATPAPVASSATTTTTTVPHHTTTTTAARPNPAVKVLVANGGAVTGAAAYFTNKLKADGWTTLTPTNLTPVSSSAVYYASGQQASAGTVASDVGLSASAVHPVATAPTVSGATGADVILVVGPDLSSQVSSGGTTAATTTSS